jgi:hypothetical protein
LTDEANDFIDFINDSFDDDMSERKERRTSRRFEGQFPARIQDEECVAQNISEKGILLQTSMSVHLFPLDKIIDFELRLQEQWMLIKGKVMWIQSDSLHAKIGLFIEHAPESYFEFLQEPAE